MEAVPVKRKYDFEAVNVGHGGEAMCGLHPSIHTLPEFNLAQDIESIKKRSQSSSVSLKDE
jgi:hypothetical protein